MTTNIDTKEPKQLLSSTGGIIALFVIAAAGVGTWIYQLTQGMALTGLSQQIVWALYIAAFFSAVGAGAGMLFLTGLSEFFPLIPVAKRRLHLIASLACFIAGGLLIMLDVGNPAQVWRIITAGRFSSMMTWDFWLLIVVGIVTLLYFFLGSKSTKNPLLGGLSITTALAVVVVEGWMLSSMSARPLWGGGSVVVSFLLAALVGGIAIWFFVEADPPSDTASSWLKTALILSLVVVFADVVTPLVGGSPRETEEIRALVLTGTAAPSFWFQIILGLAVPITLLVLKRFLKLAAILALLGVLAEKIWLLVAGQATPWMQLPEGSYFFTWVEAVAVVGVVAIGILAYLGMKKILGPTVD